MCNAIRRVDVRWCAVNLHASSQRLTGVQGSCTAEIESDIYSYTCMPTNRVAGEIHRPPSWLYTQATLSRALSIHQPWKVSICRHFIKIYRGMWRRKSSAPSYRRLQVVVTGVLGHHLELHSRITDPPTWADVTILCVPHATSAHANRCTLSSAHQIPGTFTSGAIAATLEELTYELVRVPSGLILRCG